MAGKHQNPPQARPRVYKVLPKASDDHNGNSSFVGPNVPTKEDLWKGAEIKTLANNHGWIIEMTGLDSKSHTVYARAVQTADYKSSAHPTPSVCDVVEGVVDVAWKHVARHILEAKKGGTESVAEILMVDLDHWNQGAFPPANQLLELGAVWLVNETSFLQQETAKNCKKHQHSHTKKKRLTSKEQGEQKPDWKDFVLRVHYAPNRYHAMEEVDWNKYCRGLLLNDGSIQVFIGGKLLAAHNHIYPSGYPDKKDGVIVYEDAEHGFVVLNKPGTVPDHATVNNHAEDVLSIFSHVLQEREKLAKQCPKEKGLTKELDIHHHDRAAHLNLPLPLDTETQGLIVLATKRAFSSYLTNMVEAPRYMSKSHVSSGIIKKYKCLICVKEPESMVLLNNLQESGAIVTHYYHHNPNHKEHTSFVQEIPKGHHSHEYGSSQIRLLKIGTNHGLYAANVTADSTVGDTHLARRLWGLGVQNHSTTPAEDLGVAYVTQLEVEHLVVSDQLHTRLNKTSRLTAQQLICGQLAAMGFPLVGDSVHGGGTSEVWGHRHGWNRLALQCCEWSFPQPEWKATSVEESSAPENGVSAETPEDEKPKEEQKKVMQAPGEESEEWKSVSHSSKKKTSGREHGKPKKEHHTNTACKRTLQASKEGRCVFRLNEAWWNPLLDQYHVDGF